MFLYKNKRRTWANIIACILSIVFMIIAFSLVSIETVIVVNWSWNEIIFYELQPLRSCYPPSGYFLISIWSGVSKSRDWKDNELPLMLLLLELPAIGASAPIAKFVKIPGLNSGRNSWSAVGKTVLTKLKKHYQKNSPESHCEVQWIRIL